MGLGGTPEEKVHNAVNVWSVTTASAALEVLEMQGDHATYLPPHAPDGFPGWHSVHGPVIGWGGPDQQELVRDWLMENPVLPTLAPVLAQTPFPRPELIGVKVFLGGSAEDEVAEVRVNGAVHVEASTALWALGWPRATEGASYARSFIVLIEPGVPE